MYERRRRRRGNRRISLAVPILFVAVIATAILGFARNIENSEGTIKELFERVPENAGTEEKLMAISSEIPEAKTILNNISSYPSEIVELIFHNPETAEFVEDYPKNSGGTSGKPDISKEGRKGKIPHFLQWDKRWGYDPYGTSCIAVSGCGPTCLSIVYTALSGNDDYDPKTMAEFSSKNGYYIEGTGTSWQLMTEGAQKIGLKSEELPLAYSAIEDALERDRLIIASMGKGDFTDSGHFIVISGTERGQKLNVVDPNSIRRTKTSWDFDRLSGQIMALWSYSI